MRVCHIFMVHPFGLPATGRILKKISFPYLLYYMFFCLVLLKFWYIYVSKFEETFICKREIDALPPIIRFAVFILLTEPSRIPLFNLLAIELLMAE